MTRKPAFQASPTNANLQEIQTEPERRVDMPYAPAMRVESPCGLLFVCRQSGVSSLTDKKRAESLSVAEKARAAIGREISKRL